MTAEKSAEEIEAEIEAQVDLLTSDEVVDAAVATFLGSEPEWRAGMSDGVADALHESMRSVLREAWMRVIASGVLEIAMDKIFAVITKAVDEAKVVNRVVPADNGVKFGAIDKLEFRNYGASGDTGFDNGRDHP